MHLLRVALSTLASGHQWPRGMYVGPLGPRPAERLVLYEFEACPFCRKVREALTMLDLSVEVRPCPKQGKTWRPELVARGGKAQFPYLIDPNTGREMYESADIIDYLYATYGTGAPHWSLRLGPLTHLTSMLASLWRPMSGRTARASRQPDEPLELYSFDISPYCRLARETLCELELPYILHNVGKSSPSRPAFVARSGRMRVPYLVDPNTGAEMFESADIVAYLNATYAA